MSAHADPVPAREQDALRRGRLDALETDRLLLIEALEKSESLFREAFRSSPVAMSLSVLETGVVVDINPAFLDVLGMSRAEVIGRSSHRLDVWCREDQRAGLIAELRAQGRIALREIRLRRRDGTEVPVYLTATLLPYGGEPHLLAWVIDATAIHRTEEALRAAEARWQSLIAQAPAVITIVDRAGTVLSLNRTVTGRPAAEVVGKPVYEALPEEIREPSRRRLREVFETGLPVRFELALRTPEGGTTWIENRLGPVAVGGEVTAAVSVITDVTARREAEAALRESEQRYRDLLRSMADWVWEMDARGRFTFVSEQFESFVGFPPGGLLGKSPTELLDPEDAARGSALLADLLLRQAEFEFEAACTSRRGKAFLAISGVPRLDADGTLLGYRGVARDLTARVRAEEERRRMEAEVHQARRVESLGLLAGGIAHDFNNLLAAILGNAELALAELPAGSEAAQLVAQIQKAGTHAAELTRQMLAYAGRGRFATRHVDLSAAAGDMAQLLRSSIPKKANLAFELGEALPHVEADPTQLRQIVMNLVLNAAESLGGQEGRVTVRTAVPGAETIGADLSLGALEPGREGVVLEVADTGCGMDRETLVRIFDPFYTTKFTGRGLGLAAVQGIVLRHGGRVEVRSRPGEGSLFRVTLPVAPEPPSAPSPPAAAVPRPAAAACPWRGSGTLLLVDDEEPVRRMASRMLAALGFEVLTAADGAEALEVLAGRGAGVRAVLLDLAMPRMDGRETFRELRRRREDLPVVLCSGYDVHERADHLAGLGFSGFLRKPFRLDDLALELRRALGE